MDEALFWLSTKALLFNPQGELLLIQKPPKPDTPISWDLPGGRIHHHEASEEALRREVYEETGLTHIDALSFIMMRRSDHLYETTKGRIGLIFAFYRGHLSQDEPITLSDEHVTYQWLSPNEAAPLLTFYPIEFISYVKSSL